MASFGDIDVTFNCARLQTRSTFSAPGGHMVGGTFILFVVGLGFVAGGAHLFVRGASGLAVSFGVSPLVIGLTVVAYGTSAPELAVSLRASMAQASDVAIGNVVGSNIYNIVLILGLASLAVPLSVSRQLLIRDVPLMIGLSIVLVLMSADGRIQRIEGVLLAAACAAYTTYSLRTSRREVRDARLLHGAPATDEHVLPFRVRWGFPIAKVLIGTGVLVLGAGWVKDGAVDIAQHLGVSELVIALTVVAIGTSLPELATSVAASMHGERDMAVGNAVGSNIFNILLVIGVAAAFSPGGLAVAPQALHFDMPVMLALAVACWPLFAINQRISRAQGAFFLLFGAFYAAFLVYKAGQGDVPTSWDAVVVIGFVLLPAVMLVIAAERWWKSRQTSRP